MSKEYITMDNRRAYTYICELDKVNKNLRKIEETITIDKDSPYYDCISIADTTSSLRSDLDELKDYLKEKEKETNKKKRRISVRIRL